MGVPTKHPRVQHFKHIPKRLVTETQWIFFLLWANFIIKNIGLLDICRSHCIAYIWILNSGFIPHFQGVSAFCGVLLNQTQGHHDNIGDPLKICIHCPVLSVYRLLQYLAGRSCSTHLFHPPHCSIECEKVQYPPVGRYTFIAIYAWNQEHFLLLSGHWNIYCTSFNNLSCY